MTKEEKRVKLHKKHGCPHPTGHEVSKDVKAKAVEIAADHTKLLIRYTRKDPMLIKDLKKGDDPYDKPAYKIIKGEPLGVLIAFKDDGKLLIGWSQRHTVNEPLSFTREDARVCAVLRGLLDSISMKSKEDVFTSIEGQCVPSPLKYHIPSFVNRAHRFFRADKVDNMCDERLA